MNLIKELKKNDENFNVGKIFVPLFNQEIDVFIESTVSLEYAEECANNIVNLSKNNIEYICNRAIDYYKYMLEEWDDETVEEIKKAIPETLEGKEIFKYISVPKMFIFEPKENIPAYNVECKCVWEPEHGLDLIIRGDDVLYVGAAYGFGAWADEDEYEVDY